MALRIFCRRIRITGPERGMSAGPLLIVANHPNSFLDAVIIAACFKKPVYSLARGDAFRKSWHNRLLRMLNMVPVYRISEGKENLRLNEDAFAQCKKVFERGGIVLIFIEGISINSHQLQPFKKGAARIAIQNNTLADLKVLPLAINYDSLTDFGKSICVQTTDPLPVASLLPFDDEAKNMRHFNERIYEKLETLITPVPTYRFPRNLQRLVFLPALAGYLLHAALYALVKNAVLSKTRGTIFYDSVLFGVLFFVYPAYLLLVGILLLMLKLPWIAVMVVLILHPLSAWAAVQFFKNPGRNLT